MLRVKQITVYDQHPESPRVMFEWKDGRYTFEQWQLIVFMDRLEKKLDALQTMLAQ